MMIAKVDAHHHLWSAESPHHPGLNGASVERFFGETGRLPRGFDRGDLRRLATASNVIASVYVDSQFEPAIDGSAVVEATYPSPFPAAILGQADISTPDLPAVLDRHQASPRFRGLRLAVNWDADPRYRSAPRDGLLRDPA